MMAAESSATDNYSTDGYLETLSLDSSASASTDPLLHPPPSPSSTSSPTAPANDDAFIDENGEDDFPQDLPAQDTPVISREPSPELYRITVSEPRKHDEPATGAAGVIPGSGSYFSYLVTTQVGDGGKFVVRRRFRDVVALADRIASTHRGLFIPPRPDKSIVEGQVMQRHDFVNQRCAALQRYLCRLAAHPTVGRSVDLQVFLTEASGIPTSEGESPRCTPTSIAATSTAVTTPTTPAKGGRDFFGMFKDLKQTVSNGLMAVRTLPLEEETDTKFVAHKAKLEELEQQLSTTSQQVVALVKAHEDLRETTAHLGMTFIKLAKFEKGQSSCSSQISRAADVSNFASAVVKVSRSQTKLNAEIVKHLGTIHEYLETMSSVHNAFSDRSNALLHVQSLSSDLNLLHNRVAKLESVSSRGIDQERSRYQKIEELKETIRATEDAKIHARKEYELIKIVMV
ncbi:hypothetical protein BRADI_2g53790v3 [Brachypodium distachyon]|uniref:PX domain-containing protein n=1 Tax=Brachypodium distachyon TaxID=15368 RepID=A0A0Q3N1D5_BRADI|nr:hypothetical protein BRADI_2g53790v3 [Brachypodium distachyon]